MRCDEDHFDRDFRRVIVERVARWQRIVRLTIKESNGEVSGIGTASAELPGWQANGETE